MEIFSRYYHYLLWDRTHTCHCISRFMREISSSSTMSLHHSHTRFSRRFESIKLCLGFWIGCEYTIYLRFLSSSQNIYLCFIGITNRLELILSCDWKGCENRIYLTSMSSHLVSISWTWDFPLELWICDDECIDLGFHSIEFCLYFCLISLHCGTSECFHLGLL